MTSREIGTGEISVGAVVNEPAFSAVEKRIADMADRMIVEFEKSVGEGFGGSLKVAKRHLEDLARGMERVRKEADKLRSGRDADMTGILPELTPGQLDSLREMTAEVRSLNAEASKGAFGDAATKGIRGIVQLKDRYVDLGETIDWVNSQGTKWVNEGLIGIEQYDSALAKLISNQKRTATGLEQAIEGVLKKAELGIIGFSTAALYAFAGFESQLTQLLIRVPELGEAAQAALVDSVRTLSDELEVGVSEILSAGITATRFGLNPEEFTAVTNAMAPLAHVTGDLTGAITTATLANQVFGESIGTNEEVAEKLWVTMREGVRDLGGLGTALAQVGGLTAGVGVDFDELLAIFTTTGRRMLTTGQTMTSLFRIIAKLQDPTDEVAAAFRDLGVESLPQAIQKFGGLTGVLVELQKWATKNGVAFDDLIGGFYSMRVAMALVEGEGAGVADSLDQIRTSTGTLIAASEEVQGTLGAGFGSFREELGETLTLLGEGVAVIVGPALSVLEGIIEGLNSVLAENKTLAAAAGVALGGLAALLVVNRISRMIKQVSLLTDAIGFFILREKTAAVTVQATTVAMEAQAGAAVALNAAILGVAAAFAIIGYKVLDAWIKKNQKIADGLALIEEKYESLIGTLSEDEATVRAFLEGFLTQFQTDDDLAALEALGFTIEDIAKAAAGGEEEFTTLSESIQRMIELGKAASVPGSVVNIPGFAPGTAEEMERVNAAIDDGLDWDAFTDLTRKLNEVDTIATKFFKNRRDNEIIGEVLADIDEAALGLDGSTEAIRKSFDRPLPAGFTDSLRGVFADVENAVNIFDRIDATAQQKIDGLMNTLMFRPIEQVRASKEDMAAALAENARVIDAWLNTIDDLKGQGNVRLSEMLAQLGPEFTAAFQDMGNDPAIAEAADGMLNELYGGFKPEEIAGTWGELYGMAVEDPKFTKALDEYGVFTAASYLEGAVNWWGQEEAHAQVTEGLASLMGLATTKSVDDAKVAGEPVGNAMIDGVVQGVIEKIPFLAGAVQRAARIATRAFESAWEVSSPSRVGFRLGGNLMAGVWLGILEGASSGASSIAGRAASVITDALSLSMREQVQSFMGAIGDIMSYQDSQDRVQDAASAIEDLFVERDISIPIRLGELDEEIKVATATGGEGVITASEQVGIEKAQKNVKDLELAYKQGFITIAELEAGREALSKAEDDAIKKSEERIQLEEEKAALEERLIGIDEDLEDAFRNLDRAQLALIESMLGAVDAAQLMSDQNPEVREWFDRLAEMAGLPKEAIDGMIASIGPTMDALEGAMNDAGFNIETKIDGVAGSGMTGGGAEGFAPIRQEGLTQDVMLNYQMDKYEADFLEKRGMIIPDYMRYALGGRIGLGQFGLVGERGPELIRGPADVTSTQMTDSLLRDVARGGSGGEYNINVPVTVGFPVNSHEAREIAYTIRDAIRDIEREDA